MSHGDGDGVPVYINIPIASGEWDTNICIWDVSQGRNEFLLHTLEGHEHTVGCLCWNQNGEILLSGSHDRTIRLWNALAGTILSVIHGHEGGIRSLSVSPYYKLLASASHDKTIRIWDFGNNNSSRCIDNDTSHCIVMLYSHSKAVTVVSWSKCGKYLASGTYDNTVCIWDAVSSSSSTNNPPPKVLINWWLE